LIWAVLDTNTLVSGFGWPRSIPGRVVDRALAGQFLLVTSRPLLDELDRVLRYPRLTPIFPDPSAVVLAFERAALVVTPQVTLSVARDPADDRVLEAAVEASADAIVTGDEDLLALKSYERIRIVPARTFLELLNRQRRRLP
jgi:putative PIN family toxin of toxin-antitoxin system